jgi:YfiH family protein
VAVRVADCLPLLLADDGSGAVAAVHAGWRGVVAGVVAAGFQALRSVGGGPASGIHAALFPHIRSCCFEVGEGVAEQLVAAYPGGADDAAIIDRGRPRPHVNLAAIVRAQLAALGVTGDRIDEVPGCTRCGGDRFCSYRRDGKAAGRHLAGIAVRG